MPVPVRNSALGLKVYIIPYVQPTPLQCHSVRSNTVAASSNSTTCTTSNFMMSLQREIVQMHLLSQPPRLYVYLSVCPHVTGTETLNSF
jgi:hypothetical protein